MAKRHAVIVGINQYPNLAHLGNYDLYGCINDARLMKQVLVDKFNFAESEIVELHDERASRAAIVGEMNRLVDEVDDDDIVVFHFSGHGSRRTSEDEGAAKDSTIMPHDSGRDPRENRDISDKEVNEWLGRLTRRTRYVTLVFDCCHSGTMTRDIFSDPVRSAPDDSRSIAAMGLQPASQPTRSLDRDKLGAAGWLEISDSYVVISGCRDNELSHEFPRESTDRRNGALTHFLTQALMQSGPGTTYRDAFEFARGKINAKWSDQNPQIDGRQDREVFGVTDIEPIRFVPVRSVDGDKVVLGGGRAHGLFPGSQWTVYPPGTKKTAGTASLGVLDITDVGALTTEAVVRESRGDIVPDARCVESAPAVGQYRMPVDLSQLDTAARETIAAAIGGSNLLTTDTDTIDNELRFYVLAPRESVTPDDPVPQVPRVAEPTWAVVDRAGQLTMPLHATSEPGVIDILVENLETIARFRNALDVNNPDSGLDVRFNIYRKVGEDWQLANGGDTVFKEGDRIALEIVNNESKPVHLCILDFEPTRAISIFYPTSGRSEMLDAGKTLRLGFRERVVPSLDPKDQFPEDRGIETLKAFITTEESDFSWLQQGATRAVDPGMGSLRQQFEAAFNGPATRAVRIEAESDPDDWKSINRSFCLQRRMD